MITIDDKYLSTVINALKLQRIGLETVLKMDEYQRLEYFSQFEQFAFMKEMLASKSHKDLLEDMEIKGLMSTQDEIMKKEIQESIELIELLESYDPTKTPEIN